tara:strand:+ start:6579 stop:6683 length:105 start_codon:yes stop_codon:yes gene_type:complete
LDEIIIGKELPFISLFVKWFHDMFLKFEYLIFGI